MSRVLRPSLRVVLAALAVLLGAPLAGAQLTGATVVGTVRDSTGRAIADVEVGVMGAGTRVRTDAAGEYRIVNLLAGRATVVARRLGFVAGTRPVRLLEGESRRVDFVLAASVQTLEATNVVAARDAYASRLAGFNERSTKQVGHFVTRERIERANSATLVDVLREIPGLRVGGQTNRGRLVRIRSSTCPPLVFIDGFPASAGEFDLDMIDLQTVEGIEVYSGLGSLPAEFTGPRDLDRCGVIAIWSRPSRSRRASVVASGAPAAVPAADPYTADQVEIAARPDSGTLSPAYPDSLFRAGRAGRVVVEFVVDTAGNVEPGSVEVLEGSEAGFVEAVRATLQRAHFQPAVAAGRRVRQFVQLPFTFALEGARPGGTTSP